MRGHLAEYKPASALRDRPANVRTSENAQVSAPWAGPGAVT
ncbi:hypothetical protein [Pseudonocardia kunmingensis]|nr:hypothetical protein [Pseudonocardia kunmingensis]